MAAIFVKSELSQQADQPKIEEKLWRIRSENVKIENRREKSKETKQP